MRALLFLLLVACGAASFQRNPGSRVDEVASAPSGKHLAIYKSTAFTTQPRDVPEDVVIQAMRASSMFFDEDIRAFSKQVSDTLPKLEDDQRLVIEMSDTAVHMFVENNELQVVAFRDGQEVSHHASAIPTAAVKTELQARTPHPPPTTTPPPPVASVPPPVETKPVDTPPPPPVDDKTKVATKPKKAAPPPKQKRLTEAEIRAKLDELDRLLAKQLITQTEYDQKKKALLDQL